MSVGADGRTKKSYEAKSNPGPARLVTVSNEHPSKLLLTVSSRRQKRCSLRFLVLFMGVNQ